MHSLLKLTSHIPLLLCHFFFFFNDAPTPEIYTLSLHDALPIFFCVSKNVSVSCAYTQGKREQFSGFNRTLDAINNVFRKFSAFHDETGCLNVDGMNIISNDGSNKLNRSRKARVSYKVQRTINASLNAATSTRAVSSNPNFVTRQKIEIIFGQIQNGRSLNELNRSQSGLETYGLFSNLTHDFLPISG